MMSKRAAEKLWDTLRASLITSHESIVSIIEQRAWEPLGYDTFFAAWSDKMSDVDLFTVTITHVVYQMVSEEIADVEISSVVKGVGPEAASALRRQRENGVPPDKASLRPQVGPRKSLGSRGTLFLHVGPERLKEWTETAEAMGTTVTDFALEELSAAFDRALNAV